MGKRAMGPNDEAAIMAACSMLHGALKAMPMGISMNVLTSVALQIHAEGLDAVRHCTEHKGCTCHADFKAAMKRTIHHLQQLVEAPDPMAALDLMADAVFEGGRRVDTGNDRGGMH